MITVPVEKTDVASIRIGMEGNGAPRFIKGPPRETRLPNILVAKTFLDVRNTSFRVPAV